MATNEPPPPQKRMVAEITPPDVGKSVEETSRTYYVLEEGRYVPVKKGSDVAPAPAPEPDSDEDVDPVLEAEYNRQLQESDGFDLNVCIPNGSLFPYKFHDHHEDELRICTRVGLHCFNFHKGSNIMLCSPD